MQKIFHTSLIISTILCVLCTSLNAQEWDTIAVTHPDSLINSGLPLSEFNDTINIDLNTDADSTILLKKKSGSDISSEVVYSAKDSIVIGMGNRKVFLYGEAKVAFEQIELTANYIEFDMSESQVYAKGTINDTTGLPDGLPVFQDAGQTFNAQTIKYNFKSKKGYIEAVKTQQDEGYLHSAQTKKDEFGHIHMKDGKYTTCDLDHPHFYLALTKAKSIPGDKIISGPAYLVIADIPLPIGLPFGFFPNTKTNTSGILIPTYGEEYGRGFYLSNGGYYFAINDYMDLRLTGDIYTNGTWGIRAGTQYKARYKFNGSFNARYFKNISGEKGLDNYSVGTDYSIQWSHNQDAKSNPSQQFRASVNLSTRRFDQNHSKILTNALTNTKQSSISYQKKFQGTPFNLTASGNHSQNSNTGAVDLNLPKVSLTMATIYPFRGKESSGSKWFEQIQVSYNSNFDNQIRTVDTLLFKPDQWLPGDIRTGFKHDINPAYNFKFKRLKIFTISPNIRYTGVAYTNYIRKYREQVIETDTSYYRTATDTINKFSYAHAYYPSLSMQLTPKIYGMYQFKPGAKISAIRHVMSPTASLSLVPDMRGIIPNYYEEVRDENGKLLETYSKYANGIYGAPSPNGRVRTMSFALRNTLEMKVREDSDTATKYKKVSILESLNFNTNMNFDDSIKFQPISMNGSTRFLKDKVNLSFSGSFDPYATDSLNRRINVSNYKANGKLTRMTSASLSMGTNFSSKAKKGAGTEGQAANSEFEPGGTSTPAPGTDSEYDTYDEDYYGGYVDFNVPWSISADYSLNYSKPVNKVTIIQTLRFTGDFSLTPKWKIGYNTGYDIDQRKVTTTNVSIYRDLHCWEMRLTAVPFGIYKSFNFQINAKSAILQDMKYNKRIPWQDNFR